MEHAVIQQENITSELSLIIPCFEEEAAIPIFYQKTTAVLKTMNCSYEILFIDDGSGDNTLQTIEKLASQDEHIRYISFSRNFGKEAAMYAGFANTRGRYVAVMDVDLQDPPALLPDMMKMIQEEDCDSVATRRVTRQGEPVIKSFFARMFYRIINKISDADIADGARDFRLMKRQMADVIVEMHEYNRFSKGIFGWIGFKTKWLPYENQERVAGESKWSLWKLTKYALDGIINFSQVPLSIASWFGIFMTAIAFLFIVFIIVRKLLFGDPVSGWPSLVCIITLIGGIQLFCMGIMGQYIAKTYMEVKKRPHYIVGKSNIKNISHVK